MKFAKRLGDHINEDWRFYYLDYDGLKRQLKDRTAAGKFTEQDEATFVEQLERELEKVASFRQIKGDELTRRVEHCEHAVFSIVRSNAAYNPDDSAILATIKDDVDRITEEVAELSKYTRINYTGFMKIIKKHDKHTSYQLKPMFSVLMNNRPFYKENVDSLIVRLSKLFETVRTGIHDPAVLHGVQGTPRPGKVQSNFVRKTTKYWVHPDNVTEVKCIILKYLPVLVVTGKGGNDPSPAVSSVYLDNDSFDLYTSRLERKDGGEAIRLRWYGNMDQSEIFVERKTHRDEHSTETSIKSRFSIKEKYVNEFLKGDFTVDRLVTKIRDRNVRSDKEISDLELLASQIQQRIKEKDLKPVIRTFYNRTAFQLPGDSRVRISLDTDLTFIREDNEGRVRSGKNWRRTDCGVTSPFNYLPTEDYQSFPFAVLEVKVETTEGASVPTWVEQLVSGHLVEEVPKFSKFIHGVATLLEGRVSLLPFWLTQMERNMLSPPAALAPTSSYTSGAIPAKRTQKSSRPANEVSSLSGPSSSMTPAGSDEITVLVDSGMVGNVNRNHKRASGRADERTPLLSGAESISSRAPREDAGPPPRHADEKSWWKWWASSGGSVTPAAPAPVGGAAGYLGPDGKRLPPNKRIAIPVRVEPKVFFANERTFLSWLNSCIVIASLAIALLNLGDRVGQIAGLLFTLVAMMFMVYSLFLFQWRAQKIRDRDPGPYDDRVGPTVLVIVLFAAITANFYLNSVITSEQNFDVADFEEQVPFSGPLTVPGFVGKIGGVDFEGDVELNAAGI
ncbi:vacuolar transporter chaperone [Dinochytrium kinnereticum]|nr:vacuolar transporter chaperone [Dinochytrium kinnereticum]